MCARCGLTDGTARRLSDATQQNATVSGESTLPVSAASSQDASMTKGTEKRDVRFSMRIPASLHRRLRKAAEADTRTMADLAIILLDRGLTEIEAARGKR